MTPEPIRQHPGLDTSALLSPGLHVAAFDFDGTLTRGDTLLPFLAAGMGWRRFGLALLRCSPSLVGHALGLVRNDVAKARLLAACLAGRPRQELAQWAQRWCSEQLPGQLRGWAMRRLAWHQAAGHRCVMVSASPDIYLQRAADFLGFDGLVCTELEIESGRLTGRMTTPNCHGEQKVVRLQAWLRQHHDPEALAGMTLFAYGDTAGDKPLLRLAHQAWYRGQPWERRE